MLGSVLSVAIGTHLSSVACRERDRGAHAVEIERAPARADVLIRPNQIDGASARVVAAMSETLNVPDLRRTRNARAADLDDAADDAAMGQRRDILRSDHRIES